MSMLLKGIGASSGKATGSVRILKDSKDFTSFLKGEILVTELTSPTMVPMMSKSVAIVCDIGGLTSHPSIVSRELGIPCVVGTKNATTVLKNGLRKTLKLLP